MLNSLLRHSDTVSVVSVYEQDLTFPYEQIAHIGQSVTIYCRSQYHVNWRRPDLSLSLGNFTEHVGIVGQMLISAHQIWNVQPEYEGHYFCDGMYNKNHFYSLSIITVVGNLSHT